MRQLFFTMFILVSLKGISQKSIYDYKTISVSGQEIDFNDFRGKLIMVVNTASGSERKHQMQQFNKLCHFFTDSFFVLVAFPSNDFLHELKTNSQLANLYSRLQPNFFIAEKCNVNDANISPIYKWLTQINRNGVIGDYIKGDFQKFIIDKTGKIVAVYSGAVDPMDTIVVNALKSHNN